MTALRQRTLQVAKNFLGVKEEGGPNRGPWVSKFLQFAKVALGNPWCAAFAVYCCHKAAADLNLPCAVPKTASTSAIARWAKQTGNMLDKPVDGCIGLLKGDAYGTGYEHTYLVHTVNPDGTLVTVEGNLSNRVRWNKRSAAGSDFARIVTGG